MVLTRSGGTVTITSGGKSTTIKTGTTVGATVRALKARGKSGTSEIKKEVKPEVKVETQQVKSKEIVSESGKKLTGRQMLSRDFTEELKKGTSVSKAIDKTSEPVDPTRKITPVVSSYGVPPTTKSRRSGTSKQITIKKDKDIELISKPKDKPFLSLEGQKQRLERAGQTFELVGRQIGNVFVPGQPFTDRPVGLTTKDKITKFVTSPGFVFGAPLAVAAGSVPAIAKVGGALAKTQVGKFVVSGTKAAAGGIALTKAGQAVGQATLTKEQKELFEDPRVQKAFLETREEAPDFQRRVSKQEIKGGFEKAIGAFKQDSFIKGFKEFEKGKGQILKGSVQLGSAFLAEEITAFGRAAEEGESKALFQRKLKEQGFSERQIEEAGAGFGKKALAEDVGQLAGVIFAGREAEAFGRAGTAGVTGTTFGTKFAKTGGIIGQAGVFEGATIEATTQIQKGKDLNQERIFGASALGGISASALGGVVGGLSGTKRGSAFEKTLYVFDPSEPLGDITQDIFEKGVRRAPKGKVLTVGGVPQQDSYISLSFDKSGQPTATQLSETKGVSDRRGQSKVVSVQESFPVQPFTDNGKSKPFVPVEPMPQTPVQPFVQTPVQPFVQTPVQTQTDVPVNPFVQTPVQTQTQTQTQTQINPFSFTPQGLPVIPFIPGGGGGRGARSRLKRVSQPKEFVSSLGASVLGIRGEKTQAGVLTGLGIRPLMGGDTRRKKTSKKSKRR